MFGFFSADRPLNRSSGLGEPHPNCLPLLSLLAALPLPAITLLSPPELVRPTFCAFALTAACLFAAIAWIGKAKQNSHDITHWDVAGAFAFFGIAAGMLSEPEHVLKFVGISNGP